MTFQTLGYRFSGAVRYVMAAAALRHNVRIIVPQRVVGMKDFMALGAGNCLVQVPVIFEPIIMCRMAAGAFLQRQRLYLKSINAALNGFCSS